MTKRNLNTVYTPFVNTAFGAGNTCPPEEGIVIGDGSNRHPTQVFLPEVGNLAMDPL